jgi:hypothetical protein
MQYIPYTYLIGWTTINKWYYGSRTARNYKCLYKSGCHPDDLFNTYFTSSKEVSNLIKEHGHPDIIQIRKTFPNNPKNALRWEGKVLRMLKIGTKNHWINRGYLHSVPNSWSNVSKEMRKVRGQHIAQTQLESGVHNFLKINRDGRMGNEFNSETAKENAVKRMKNGTNPFCKLCCVDEDGYIVWTKKEVFLEQKHTNKLVMNSSKEGKRRIMDRKQ